MLDVRIDDDVALAGLSHPPVNSIGLPLRRILLDFFSRVGANRQVRAVVLYGAGRGFCAGGDLREFGTPLAATPPGLSSEVHPAIEQCPVPVVAALHGFAMGGGLETALACHYRIALASTRLRLPEVSVGVLPLSGTQRVPRVLGAAQALAMVIDGREYTAGELRDTAMFDSVFDGKESDLLAAALKFARQCATHGARPLIRNRRPLDDRWRALLDAQPVSTRAGRDALASLRAAYESADYPSGEAIARQLYDALLRER